MNWSYIFNIVRQHRSTLVAANTIAILSALLSVPVPMLMPMMVDEVLLDKPGEIVAHLEAVLPEAWHGPVVFIVTVMLVTMLLRLASLMLAAGFHIDRQGRQLPHPEKAAGPPSDRLHGRVRDPGHRHRDLAFRD